MRRAEAAPISGSIISHRNCQPAATRTQSTTWREFLTPNRIVTQRSTGPRRRLVSVTLLNGRRASPLFPSAFSTSIKPEMKLDMVRAPRRRVSLSPINDQQQRYNTFILEEKTVKRQFARSFLWQQSASSGGDAAGCFDLVIVVGVENITSTRK